MLLPDSLSETNRASAFRLLMVIAVEPDWAMPPLPVDSAIRLSVFTLVGAMLLTMLMPAP